MTDTYSPLAAGGTGVRIQDVQEVAAEVLGVPREAFTWRSRRHVRPRQITMRIARDMTGHSLPMIGRWFGRRDHTTVLWALSQVERYAARDPGIAEVMTQIKSEVLGRIARQRGVVVRGPIEPSAAPDVAPPAPLAVCECPASLPRPWSIAGLAPHLGPPPGRAVPRVYIEGARP